MGKKIIIELPDEPKDNDILLYRNGQWHNTNVSFLYKDLSDKIDDLQGNIAEFKNGVNNKIKDLYEVLQVLTKGE